MRFSTFTAAALPVAALGAAIPSNHVESHDQCSIPTGDCSFYEKCIESNNQCGAVGYALNLGRKTCDHLNADKPSFSDSGKNWLEQTKICLQQSLVPFTSIHGVESLHYNGEESICDKIEHVARGSHTDCFLNNGLCTLPLLDLKAALRLLDFQDICSDEKELQLDIDLLGGCAEFYKTAIQAHLSLKKDEFKLLLQLKRELSLNVTLGKDAGLIEIVDKLWNDITGKVDGVKEKIEDIKSDIKDKVEEHKGGSEDCLEGCDGKLEDKKEEFANKIEEIKKAIQDKIDEHKAGCTEGCDVNWDEKKAEIISKIEVIKGGLGNGVNIDLLDQIIAVIIGKVGDVKEKVEDVKEKVEDVKEKVGGVKDCFKC